MLRLIADRPLAERLGRRGRELVREQFTTERTVEAVDHLYRELAREQAPTGSPLHSTACG
jgi:glycosyltransferase involved in cell wall biosynthesis